jgi:hypothetical protein
LGTPLTLATRVAWLPSSSKALTQRLDWSERSCRQKARWRPSGAIAGRVARDASRRTRVPWGAIDQTSGTTCGRVADADGETPVVTVSATMRVTISAWPSGVQLALVTAPGSAMDTSPKKVRLSLRNDGGTTGVTAAGVVTNRTTTGGAAVAAGVFGAEAVWGTSLTL